MLSVQKLASVLVSSCFACLFLRGGSSDLTQAGMFAGQGHITSGSNHFNMDPTEQGSNYIEFSRAFVFPLDDSMPAIAVQPPIGPRRELS